MAHLKKNFVSFHQALLSCDRNHKVILEHRPKKYMFNTLNYGEIQGLYNRADGDCWDVFVPGYEKSLEVGKQYAVKSVLGVLVMDNGNHKIAVRLFVPGFDEQRCKYEIQNYVKTYLRRMKKKGMWLAYEQL